jgi:N-acetylglucosaminyldiphosphoundecaprenol N-acetyl-beta-D-mannosaminyltransferase
MYRRWGDMTWEPSDAPGVGSAVGAAPARIMNRARPRRASRPSHPLPGELLPTIRLHGVRLHAISERRTIEHILDELDAGRGGAVVTPNLDHLRRCTRDLSFGALVHEANLVVADGMPLIWASRLQGTPLPQRVAGSDLISSLSAVAANRGRSIYLLGGVPGTAKGAAEVLRKSSPNLKVTGWHCPPVGFENDPAEMNQIISKLVEAQPDIVYVALGSPKQEYLINRIRQVLPKAWWLGVGISFSFLCGDVKRAPRWLQKIGLEWLHRLVQDPRRLFHRYVVVGVPFGARLISDAAMKGIPNRLRGIKPIPDTLGFTIAADGNGAAIRSVGDHNHNGNGSSGGLDGHPNGAGHVNGDGHQAPQRIDAADGSPVLLEDAPLPSVAARHRPAHPRSARRSAPESSGSPSAAHIGSLDRLRALVLLGGSVRSSLLTEACDRSLLDLPLDSNGSVFNHWLLQADELARHAGLDRLPVRVMVNRNTPEPQSAAIAYAGKFRVERDLSEYRGTGGVLHDLAADYADDDLILVCNAAQVLVDPLPAIATALDRKEGDVTLVSHNDGTPSGVQLLSCKTLRMIPDVGFVDMKEQALPLIAMQYDVTVLHCRRPTGLPIRSLADYVVALRHYHRRKLGKPGGSDPLAEDWQPAFAIVEQGAAVDQRTHVHDSVVLKGGVVEAGAVVVRSIVCPGGVVKKDRPAVDQLVRPERSR